MCVHVYVDIVHTIIGGYSLLLVGCPGDIYICYIILYYVDML